MRAVPLYYAVRKGEEGVVSAHADILSGVDFRAALAQDYVAGQDVFAAVFLDAEISDLAKQGRQPLLYGEGFSGGEKKRLEVLQMAILKPDFAILDEADSGLDIDALKLVADGVNTLRDGHRAMLIITHFQRLLSHVVPDFVHVYANGHIVKSGGKELARELEEKGYAEFEKEA